jgi:hypothetical protein
MMLAIVFCAVCRVVYVMFIAVLALLLVCCRAFMSGMACLAMMVDECLVDVAWFSCREPHLRVLCECGAVILGCSFLLDARWVDVLCALRFAVDDLRHRFPALVVVWPYMCGGCCPRVTVGSHVT